MSFCDEDEGIPPLCADFSPSPTTLISPIPKTYLSVSVPYSMNLFSALLYLFSEVVIDVSNPS